MGERGKILFTGKEFFPFPPYPLSPFKKSGILLFLPPPETGGWIVRQCRRQVKATARECTMYSTEPVSDDLTRNCPRAAAGVTESKETADKVYYVLDRAGVR